jgi:methionyl-tRNA formyltransferase
MMRIIFMGTPDFAVPALGALLDAGHEVVGVYTQPPRAAGRGLGLRKSPVQLFAESKGLPVFTSPSLRSADDQARFKALDADVAVVVAYGLILPKAILDAPRFGCFNIHASLLPRWRGAAPIQRAIMAGDAETGVAVMRIEEELDTGAICLAERTPIWPDETAGELHDRLAALGAGLMVKALGDLAKGSLACWPQHEEGVTYAAKIEPSETRIDWSRPADEVQYQIQGLSPHPGAWFEIELAGKRERVRALRSALAKGDGRPGTLLDDRLTIACGKGAVRLTQVQRAGKRPMNSDDFLRGAALRVGALLD